MNCIAPRVFIGNTLEANDQAALQRDMIEAILCLDGCQEGVPPSHLSVKEIVVVKLKDGPGNDPGHFLHAVQELKRLSEQYRRVLVHCRAGQSRSATVAARYLMALEDYTADEAVHKMTYLHPPTSLTEGMQDLLKT
jgi:protein-tyrosine phosphatase